MITLTSWDDWIAVGVIATAATGIVTFGKNIGVIYGWAIDSGTFIRRKSVRQKLKLLEDLVFIYFEIRDEAIWRTGYLKDGSVGTVRVTSKICELVGLSGKEILGEGWKANVHQKHQGVFNAWDNAIKLKTNFAYKWAFRHDDGRTIYVFGKFHPVIYQDKFIGGLGSLEEITKEECEDWTQ